MPRSWHVPWLLRFSRNMSKTIVVMFNPLCSTRVPFARKKKPDVLFGLGWPTPIPKNCPAGTAAPAANGIVELAVS